MKNTYSSYTSATAEAKARIETVRAVRKEAEETIRQASSRIYNILNMEAAWHNGVAYATKSSNIGAKHCIARISEAEENTRLAAKSLGIEYSAGPTPGSVVVMNQMAKENGLNDPSQTIHVGDELGDAIQKLAPAVTHLHAISLLIATAAMQTEAGADSADMEIFREKSKEAARKVNELSEKIQNFIQVLAKMSSTYDQLAQKAISYSNKI